MVLHRRVKGESLMMMLVVVLLLVLQVMLVRLMMIVMHGCVEFLMAF